MSIKVKSKRKPKRHDVWVSEVRVKLRGRDRAKLLDLVKKLFSLIKEEWEEVAT